MSKDKCVFVPRGEQVSYPYYSMKQASKLLDVDAAVLGGLVRRGRLEGFKSEGKSGRWLYFASKAAVAELKQKMKEVL